MNLSTLVSKRWRMIVVCSFLFTEICCSSSGTALAGPCADLQNEATPLLHISYLTQCLDYEQLETMERVEVLKRRADLFIQLGRQNQALDDFNSALKLSPDDVECYNGRGIAYKRMGDYEQAMANYTKAMELQALQPVTRITVHPKPIISTLTIEPLPPVKIQATSPKKISSQNHKSAVISKN
jgi:lipoprotein NlpI